MKKIVFYLLLFIVLVSFSTDKPAYLVYDKNGNLSDYDKMLLAVNQADIVFFGELHNNPICHWLTLQLAKEMYENKGGRLVIGAEMFEADIQLVLDEYMNGTIKENNFEAESKLWVNYKTDYAPLVNLAKENGLKFIATNLPRRYASLVAKSGLSALDSLSRPAKNFIAPLPIKVDLQLPN